MDLETYLRKYGSDVDIAARSVQKFRPSVDIDDAKQHVLIAVSQIVPSLALTTTGEVKIRRSVPNGEIVARVIALSPRDRAYVRTLAFRAALKDITSAKQRPAVIDEDDFTCLDTAPDIPVSVEDSYMYDEFVLRLSDYVVAHQSNRKRTHDVQVREFVQDLLASSGIGRYTPKTSAAWLAHIERVGHGKWETIPKSYILRCHHLTEQQGETLVTRMREFSLKNGLVPKGKKAACA